MVNLSENVNTGPELFELKPLKVIQSSVKSLQSEPLRDYGTIAQKRVEEKLIVLKEILVTMQIN